MKDIIFLTLDDILEIFHSETHRFKQKASIRDKNRLDAALNAPRASYHSKYLMDIFEMAATYANSFCFNHPFTDGNKRVAAASALSFLLINGYLLTEAYDLELADMILSLVNKDISKSDLAKYFKTHSQKL